METSSEGRRERLLQTLFDTFGESGPSPNLSMRQVAERLGVHHTLLTYHFGSRAGALRAVLLEARRRDNLALAAQTGELGFAELCRALWAFYSAPEHQDRTRAFFHLVGLSIYDHEDFRELIADIDGLTHLLEDAARRDGAEEDRARQLSIVAASLLRGLLLQRHLSSREEVDAAAERAFAILTAAPRDSAGPSAPRGEDDGDPDPASTPGRNRTRGSA